MVFKKFRAQVDHGASVCSRYFGAGEFSCYDDFDDNKANFIIDRFCTISNMAAREVFGRDSFKVGTETLADVPSGYIEVGHFLRMNKGIPAQSLIDSISNGEIIVESAFVEKNGCYSTYYVCDKRAVIDNVNKYNDLKRKKDAERKRIDFLNKNGESAIRDEIHEDLSRYGFDAEIEKPIFTNQRMGVFAVKRGTTIVVECKKDSDSSEVSKAIGQLACYSYEHRSAINVAAFINMPSSNHKKILEANNIQVVNKASEIVY